VQARSETVVFEALSRRISDRHLTLLGASLVLAAVCLLLGVRVLPIGFMVMLVLVLLYPGLGIWKTLRRDWGPTAPRLVLGPDALEVGRDLRIRWKDVTEVAARQPSGAKRGAAERREGGAASVMEDHDPGDVQFDDESVEGDSLVVLE